MTTGPEIIEAVVNTPSSSDHLSSEKVDVFVAGAGTGGTVTGISRAIKRTHNSKCTVVGVDPVSEKLVIPNLRTQPDIRKGAFWLTRRT